MGGLGGAGGGVDGAGMASYVMFHSWLKFSVKTVPSADRVDSLRRRGMGRGSRNWTVK